MRTESGTGACLIHHQRVSLDPLSFKLKLSVDSGEFSFSFQNWTGFRTFFISVRYVFKSSHDNSRLSLPPLTLSRHIPYFTQAIDKVVDFIQTGATTDSSICLPDTLSFAPNVHDGS